MSSPSSYSKKTRPRKVLVVGMLDSVHLARWLVAFKDENIEFLLFPSTPHRRLHPTLLELLGDSHVAKYSLTPLSRLAIPLWLLDRVFSNRLRGFLLARKVESFRPDYLHAIELQNAGYVTMEAIRQSSRWAPTVIVTNYGSDIFWFSRFPRHRRKLQTLLRLSNAYSCECERDVELARNLGFTGRVMPVLPNAGGYSETLLAKQRLETRDRASIAIKGYQGWVGRAITALDAVERIADQLKDYQIELYSCNRSTIRRAKRLKKKSGLEVVWSAKGKLRHDQMIDLFGRSKVYVGISNSDGISTSLLEAMACGAIPVQTGTACCDEWFTDTGVRVETISPESVSEAILAAIQLAKEPSNAERNRQTILEKASEKKVREAALQYYR